MSSRTTSNMSSCFVANICRDLGHPSFHIGTLPFRVSLLRSAKISCALFLLCALAVLQFGCGGGSSPSPPTSVPVDQPTFIHVVLVVEENHSYSEVIGSSSIAYFLSLARQYSRAPKVFP